MAIAPEQAPDALFRGDDATGTWSNLATDDSGQQTNLTAGATWAYESSSSRCDHTGTRTVDYLCTFDDSDTGTMFSYNPTSNVSRMTLGSGGVLTMTVNSATAATYTIQNLTAATDEDFIISWTTEVNPLTTGASDAMHSELHIWNTTLGTYETTSFQHAVQTGGAADLIFGARTTGGAGNFSGTTTEIRLSQAFHTSIETSETFIAQSSVTANGVEKLEWPVPTRDTAIGDDGEFAGPVYMMVGRSLRSNDLRLVSPVVNAVSTSMNWLEDSSWTMTDPDDSNYQIHFEWLMRRPMPPHVNRVTARAFVQQNFTSATSVGWKVYCSNRPGPIIVPAASQSELVVYSNEVTRVADDDTGATGGAWVDFGALRLARDEDGYCYFYMGVYPGSATDYRVVALAIEPHVLADGDVPGGGGGIGYSD